MNNSRATIRVLFVNENIGGHATVHNHLKTGFGSDRRIEASFIDVPRPGLLRRLLGIRIPGLARLDLDFQPLRAQLALSYWVRRALKRHRGTYDVLHVYTQNAALLLKPAVPMVISTDTTNAHNAYRIPQRTPTGFTPLTVALTKPIEQRALNASTVIVANSEWAHDSLSRDYRIPEDKIRDIPFGIVESGRTVVADRRRSEPTTIGFVGRQFRAKGGQLLLDAFSGLEGEAQLLIVSTEHVRTSEGVSVVSDLEQGDDRLWDLLGRCSIFAFPSPIDQAPNAILEAMAAGLPVVAVDTGAVSEMVVHGETGFLIEAGDRNGLRSALQRLLDDPNLRRKMGAAGRRHFEQQYDMRVAIQALADVFEQLAGSKDSESGAQ